MMTTIWQQWRALLWKCWLVRRRNKLSLAAEIALPLLSTIGFALLFDHMARKTITNTTTVNGG